jgi:hypothetical protein
MSPSNASMNIESSLGITSRLNPKFFASEYTLLRLIHKAKQTKVAKSTI